MNIKDIKGGRAERDGKEYFCELKREERRDVRNEHWVDDDYKGPKEGICLGAAVVELVLYTGENIRAVVVWSNVVGGQWRLVVIYVSDEPPFRYIPPATLKATRVSQSPRYGAHGGESRKPETRPPLVGPLLTFGQSTNKYTITAAGVTRYGGIYAVSGIMEQRSVDKIKGDDKAGLFVSDDDDVDEEFIRAISA
ncbi:hypothetical protein PV325_007365 [Microctonus aethiopoides]|nr:hypothetical protein PV325_007365 [Microctonus aethiopoides]